MAALNKFNLVSRNQQRHISAFAAIPLYIFADDLPPPEKMGYIA